MAEIPINYLKYIDQDGIEKKVYPITVTDAVYDSDGNKLSNVLLGVLKDTDISNVQSDSTTTVPSSALLKATDDKIGDTSSLPGESSNVVSAITQLNSDFAAIGTVMVSAPPQTFATEIGKTYTLCSLDLPAGKWLVIGSTLAIGNILIENADSGGTWRNYREKSSPENTGMAIAFTNGNKTVNLTLVADYIVSQVHADINYCYLRAIRIG